MSQLDDRIAVITGGAQGIGRAVAEYLLRRNGSVVIADCDRDAGEELVEYLGRALTFPSGAVLLTGAGIVPPDSFTLSAGDEIRIQIDAVGALTNTVVVV